MTLINSTASAWLFQIPHFIAITLNNLYQKQVQVGAEDNVIMAFAMSSMDLANAILDGRAINVICAVAKSD